MIRLACAVTYPGGRVEQVEVTQSDFVAWELWAIRQGMSPSPTEAPPMTWTRYLGYAATQRVAGVKRSDWPLFEDWEAEDATLEDEAAAENGQVVLTSVDPSPGDRSAG